ncbi:hypothetical protein PVK06_029094 [Gossypium arboreum]|uniref:Pentatricopeptide repeat-containing protein n=1 Tax=Gossypium arboreum TaxID=29729 RepID=A0ABR0P5M4_GOSAR|nr:hypothetical protein PVK06_029094 [Gossypium arboreum]
MLSQAKYIVDTMIMQDIEPDIVTYGALIDGHCLQNQMGKAKRVSVEKGCALDRRSHNIIINGYCKAKRLDKAMELFDEITQNGPIRDIVTYNTLMQSMCQLGRVSTAFELLVKMCASGQVSNLVTCWILLDGLCKSGKLEEALKLFRAMRDFFKTAIPRRQPNFLQKW